MKLPAPDFLGLLSTLVAHRVDFIIVGGVCAVLHGAPVSTFDLDLVHSRTPDNINRLLLALETVDAIYRGQGDRRLFPDATHLASPGHQLLMTRFGPLDLLGTIGTNRDYADLLADTVEMQIGAFRVHVLDLEALIEIKEELGHEKDKAVIPVLRRILDERPRQ